MNKNILYYILLASMLIMAAAGQELEIDSSYDAPSDDFMDLDEDLEEVNDLEELDLEESSSGEHARYLRKGWPGSGGSNSGHQQLRLPSKPNMSRMPRSRAPKGWNRAKRNGRHYHGFYLHTWCDCMWGNWFCFCFE
ncbi:hypothetical protein QTG54_010225 [Skeletonema marinoi]|uniref:Uncharacterized protein n=1 Tax=Skeletonema marinoi TaxID=267567 RepID=A0AAD8Y3E7_9STRA|nr:hypothetical protein QTG54_010225 [Skeletonema marinoi]